MLMWIFKIKFWVAVNRVCTGCCVCNEGGTILSFVCTEAVFGHVHITLYLKLMSNWTLGFLAFKCKKKGCEGEFSISLCPLETQLNPCPYPDCGWGRSTDRRLSRPFNLSYGSVYPKRDHARPYHRLPGQLGPGPVLDSKPLDSSDQILCAPPHHMAKPPCMPLLVSTRK